MISVIVPLRNEGADAADRLRDLSGLVDCELIVADAGSDPAALSAYRKLGARVLTHAGSRGARLSLAAAEARGEVLFFVHADSRPPHDALAIIRRTIAEGADAGAFSLAYEGGGTALRWVAWWANLRSRVLRLPFGDQGIFCRRETYLRAGGFRDLPVCDDLDLVLRLRRAGRFAVRPEKTSASPRRYLERGAARQVLRVWKVMIGYFARVPPEKLASWYERR